LSVFSKRLIAQAPTMKTDTTRKGLETLIMPHMTGTDSSASGVAGVVAEAAPLANELREEIEPEKAEA